MKLLLSFLPILALCIAPSSADPRCGFDKVQLPPQASKRAYENAITKRAKELETATRKLTTATKKNNGKGGGGGGGGGNGKDKGGGGVVVDPCARDFEPIEVGIEWVAFSDGNEGKYEEAQALAHVALMNSALRFDCSRLSFKLNSFENIDIATDPLLQAAWGQSPLDPVTQYGKRIRQAYPGPLDCTAVGMWTWYLSASDVFGFAQFPQFCGDAVLGKEDGAVVDARALMSHEGELYGKIGRVAGGKTVVHELGHVLGLKHTHEGGCADGDLVDDTPACLELSGCITDGIDTCPKKFNPGLDLTNNFMSNSDDVCMTSFTQGQLYRMQAQADLYRRPAPA